MGIGVAGDNRVGALGDAQRLDDQRRIDSAVDPEQMNHASHDAVAIHGIGQNAQTYVVQEHHGMMVLVRQRNLTG